ncbi:hypothetical protein BCR43DRAFT_497274 [Syncephalastrum racemosum]|uniref:Uncharacterized protein n=1 Tax=Syncephalastrum racemosum TaxID=13706 RepID=A0A1X2H5H2_SYNRA|nr:hypothetical protein BCR43DRAFT_497274 [Syncephalastrum racemosum]
MTGMKTHTKSSQARYNLRPRRGSHHLLDGFPSGGANRSYESYSRAELLELQERNKRILHHKAVVSQLPDQGARLRNTIEYVEQLLNATADSTLAAHLASLTLQTPRQNPRRRYKVTKARATVSASSTTIAGASAAITAITASRDTLPPRPPGLVTKRRNSSTCVRPIDISSNNNNNNDNDSNSNACSSARRRTSSTSSFSSYSVPSTPADDQNFGHRTCMMSLAESVQLQESHHRLLEDELVSKKLNGLCDTMTEMCIVSASKRKPSLPQVPEAVDGDENNTNEDADASGASREQMYYRMAAKHRRAGE